MDVRRVPRGGRPVPPPDGELEHHVAGCLLGQAAPYVLCRRAHAAVHVVDASTVTAPWFDGDPRPMPDGTTTHPGDDHSAANKTTTNNDNHGDDGDEHSEDVDVPLVAEADAAAEASNGLSDAMAEVFGDLEGFEDAVRACAEQTEGQGPGQAKAVVEKKKEGGGGDEAKVSDAARGWREVMLSRMPRVSVVQQQCYNYTWQGGEDALLCGREELSRPFAGQAMLRLRLAPLGLSFALGMFEPFFCSVCLYDVAAQARVSESVPFEVNPEHVRRAYLDQTRDMPADALGADTVADWMPEERASQQEHMVALTVPHAHTQLFLVLRVERVLQGDVAPALEMYSRLDFKGKRSAIMDEVRSRCKRLGPLRQPFCWSAVRVFQDNLKLALDGAVTFETMFTQKSVLSDQQLCEMISDPAATRSAKVIPGSCTVWVHGSVEVASKPIPMANANANATSNGNPAAAAAAGTAAAAAGTEATTKRDAGGETPRTALDAAAEVARRSTASPSPSSTTTTKQQPDSPSITRDQRRLSFMGARASINIANGQGAYMGFDASPEMLADARSVALFHPRESAKAARVYQSSLCPHTEFRNDLFVYPLSVNFGGFRLGLGKSRNIAVRVSLRASDDVLGAESELAVFYSRQADRRHDPSSRLKSAITQVTYHSKAPTFQDEFGLALPLPLHRGHHLLFEFYHVPCEPKANPADATPKHMGYAILPLYHDHQLRDGDCGLSVYTTLAPGYLAPQGRAGLPMFDGGKEVFRVRLRAQSTVYPLDPVVNSFLHRADEFQRATPEHVTDKTGREESTWSENEKMNK